MPVIHGQVGPPSSVSAPDGTQLPILQGKLGETIVSPMHGKYYSQTVRGNTYWGSNAIGGTSLTLVTATTFVGLILWNPDGSNRLAVPIAATFTQTAAAGTGTGYGYGFISPAGSGIGALGPITAFTVSGVQRGSGLLNQSGGTVQGNSACILADTATVGAAFIKFMRGMGTGVGTVAITTPSVMPSVREDFDGSVIIPPNVALTLGLTVTSTITTTISLTWEEVPL